MIWLSGAVWLGIIGFAYGFAWYRHVAGVPFWMDEVLAVATARLPAAQIVPAIWRGAEFSPPTYDLLLHTLGLTAPGAVLAARVPSGLAVAVAGVAAAVSLHRVAGWPLALLGCALAWSGGLFYFAIQARPYALLGCCLAVTVALWRGQPAQGGWPRAVALGAIGVLAVSLTAYGVLVPAWVAAAECAYGLTVKRRRWPVWLAVAAAILAVAMWLPLYRHLAAFNAADNRAPAYYARPDPIVFVFELGYLLWPHSLRWWPLIVAVALTTVFARVAHRPASCAVADDETQRWRCALGALALLPAAGFAMSVFVTGSFSPRYIAPAALLPAFGLPYAWRRVKGAPVMAAALSVLLVLAMVREARSRDWRAPTGEAVLAAAAPGPAPIVVDQGERYIQLVEALPPALRERCVFVTTAPEITPPDPTNENQVKRLAGLLPGYRTATVPAFIADDKRFYLIASPDRPGTAMLSLRAAGVRFTRVAQAGKAILYQGEVR